MTWSALVSVCSENVCAPAGAAHASRIAQAVTSVRTSGVTPQQRTFPPLSCSGYVGRVAALRSAVAATLLLAFPASAAAPPQTVTAAFPGTNGRIAFASNRVDTTSQVFL